MRLNISTLWRSVKLGALLLAIAVPAHAVELAIDKEIVVPVGLDAAWAAWTTRDGVTSFLHRTRWLTPRSAARFTFSSIHLQSPA